MTAGVSGRFNVKSQYPSSMDDEPKQRQLFVVQPGLLRGVGVSELLREVGVFMGDRPGFPCQTRQSA